MSTIVFDYQSIGDGDHQFSYPAAEIFVLGKDNHYHSFTMYIDSGAALTVLTASDAKRLSVDLANGQPMNLYGVSGSVKAYIHTLSIKIGNHNFKVKIAFSVSDETPRLLGREVIFSNFVISFRERKQKTYFSSEPVNSIKLA